MFDAAAAACAIASFLYVFLWWLGGIRKLKNHEQDGPQLPPGPAGVPFLGCLDILLKGPNAKKAFALSSTYGSVVRIKAGLSQTIILNDLNSIRTYLSHKHLLDRSPDWVQGASIDVGFSAYRGKKWEVNRRFSLKLLREMGYGKPGMRAIIVEGCEQLVTRIAEAQGQPLDLLQLVLASACNNIGALIFGCRYSFDDSKHRELVNSVRDEFMLSRKKSMLSFLPSTLMNFAKHLPFTTAAAVHGTMESIEAFVGEHIHCETGKVEPGNGSFLAKYAFYANESRHKDTYIHNNSSLKGNAVGFLIPATVTVSAMLMRILLLVTANDEVQDRIQREIEAVVGSERQPTWEDRYVMSYTMAVMWEAQRWHTLLPLGLPRWAGQDVVIGKYLVPRGSTIIPNIWAVHNDPKHWIEPDKFDPSRFLNEDGSFALERLKNILPFSFGKRSCPGQTLASLEIFVYVTRMLQKFRIVPQVGSVLDARIGDDVIMEPGRHMLRCIPRTPSSHFP